MSVDRVESQWIFFVLSYLILASSLVFFRFFIQGKLPYMRLFLHIFSLIIHVLLSVDPLFEKDYVPFNPLPILGLLQKINSKKKETKV